MPQSLQSDAIQLPDGLSDSVSSALREFTAATQKALGPDLISLVLFGSAVEGRMRPVSDVNLLVLLEKFDIARINGLREPLRVAKVQIRLAPMFICSQELPSVVDAFAVKFDDIIRRHFTFFGKDLISSLSVSRDAMLRRVQQVLLNLELRLRERYATVSLREEQLLDVIVEMSSALRSAAASVIELEGETAPPVREVLPSILAKADRSDLGDAVALISQAREQGSLPAGSASRTVLAMLDIAALLNERLQRLC